MVLITPAAGYNPGGRWWLWWHVLGSLSLLGHRFCHHTNSHFLVGSDLHVGTSLALQDWGRPNSGAIDRMLSILLVLLCGCCAAYERPPTVTLGLLYPLVKESDGGQVVDNSGKRRLLGSLQVLVAMFAYRETPTCSAQLLPHSGSPRDYSYQPLI